MASELTRSQPEAVGVADVPHGCAAIRTPQSTYLSYHPPAFVSGCSGLGVLCGSSPAGSVLSARVSPQVTTMQLGSVRNKASSIGRIRRYDIWVLGFGPHAVCRSEVQLPSRCRSRDAYLPLRAGR